MAKELTDSEKKHFNDLEDNFDSKVEEYRNKKEKELAEGKKEELKEELENIDRYLEIYNRGEVDDLLINVRFIEAKQKVLRSLLGV